MSSNRNNLPGWNDPPILNYSAQNPPPKSRIGNKRVAFPLNPSGVTEKTTIPTMPPKTTSSIEPDIPWNSEEKLEIAKRNFKIMIDQDKTDDIERRLNIMVDMWKNGQISINIQKVLVNLSISLIEGDKSRAQQLQMQLMTEDAANCSPWMALIRHLGRI